jgi:hypothetical protein
MGKTKACMTADEQMRNLRSDPEYLEKLKARERERYAEDVEWRERRKALARSVGNRNYRNDPATRQKHRDKHQRYRSDPARWLRTCVWRGLKNRAKTKGIPFTITPADLMPLPTHCPILGIELEYGGKKARGNLPSVDRIDNARGYEPGNVWVISNRANTIKGDATLAELRLVTDAVERRAVPCLRLTS